MRVLRLLQVVIMLAMVSLFVAAPGCQDNERRTVIVPEYGDGGVYVQRDRYYYNRNGYYYYNRDGGYYRGGYRGGYYHHGYGSHHSFGHR
jgi:hypothetical protein